MRRGLVSTPEAYPFSSATPRPSDTMPVHLQVAGNKAQAFFYETTGFVKVFVFAFVFPLVAFLLLSFFVCCIHLGLLSALGVNRLLGSVHGGVR